MSSVSTTPLWGQAWELVVTYATATGSEQTTITSNSWEPKALRVTFEVLQSFFGSPWWFADIKIYNLNDAARRNTLLNATWVVLKAGFQTGDNFYSEIWNGPVLLPMYGRENVVDEYVNLHCVANPLVMDSIVGFAAGPFSSQQLVIARMADSINLPPLDPAHGTQGEEMYKAMSAKQYPRGKTCFGKMGMYLDQMANDHSGSTYRDARQAYLSEMKNGTPPNITYTTPPAPGLQNTPLPAGFTASIIGTPQQTPFGVNFEVLLDPRLRVKIPVIVVGIDRNVFFSQIPVILTAGHNAVTPFSNNLTFFVAQIRHIGDTRGNTWQTEVTGYSTTYADNLFNQIDTATSSGAP